MYLRPFLSVFLSMLPPYTRPWRPSTSTYSPLPVSTIIGRKCGRALNMPPVGTQDRGFKFVTILAPPHSPHPSDFAALRGERGRRFHYLAGGHLSFEQPPKLTALFCLYRLRDGCCYFWSPCRGRAFSEISESRGRPIHPLSCQRRPAPKIWSDPGQAPKDAQPACETPHVPCLDPTLPALK
jgi:hypothetical protein